MDAGPGAQGVGCCSSNQRKGRCHSDEERGTSEEKESVGERVPLVSTTACAAWSSCRKATAGLRHHTATLTSSGDGSPCLRPRRSGRAVLCTPSSILGLFRVAHARLIAIRSGLHEILVLIISLHPRRTRRRLLAHSDLDSSIPAYTPGQPKEFLYTNG